MERNTQVISRKKPFRQFNALISEYPDLREQWFKFIKRCYIAFVKEQIELSAISQEPFNEDFCLKLEYHLSKTFANSSDKRFRWFGCDGICMPELRSQLSIECILETKQIVTLDNCAHFYSHSFPPALQFHNQCKKCGQLPVF